VIIVTLLRTYMYNMAAEGKVLRWQVLCWTTSGTMMWQFWRHLTR